jgi:tRNA (guanine37-N1)-methyltransferase
MLKLFKKGETICDMFCGIGPLAIQAALQNLNVMANDLNPNCYKYLLQNMHLNKINTNTLIPYNMDARAFLNAMIDLPSSNNKQYLFNNTPSKCVFQHIYMNLPGDAISFCDVFTGFLLKADPTIWNLTNLPLVHVYTFSLGDTC